MPPEGRHTYVLGSADGEPLWWAQLSKSQRIAFGMTVLGVVASIAWNWRSLGMLARVRARLAHIYIYIYIYTHTHTHTYIYIYIYI